MTVALTAAAVLLAAAPEPSIAPWRQDPLFKQIAARLETVRAIDNHTHLLDPGAFEPEMDGRLPLGQRSTAPGTRRALAARFGVSAGGSLPAAAR